MPCSDGDYRNQIDNEVYKEKNFLNALICAVFRHLDGIGTVETFLKQLDYKEMGYSESDVRKWWEKHQESDKRRKAFQERLLKEREIKTKALAKLTSEERKVLGIK
jgi:hypothetical protein